MKKMWRKLFGTAALALMLCLTGLIMSGEAQAQRFVDNGNGTVTDMVTMLMWTKDANPFGRLNWGEAMSRCISHSISGIGGWRLPNGDELKTLADAIIQGGHPFTGVQWDFYWTSTTLSDDLALTLRMPVGHKMYQAQAAPFFYVWPVRAGQ